MTDTRGDRPLSEASADTRGDRVRNESPEDMRGDRVRWTEDETEPLAQALVLPDEIAVDHERGETFE